MESGAKLRISGSFPSELVIDGVRLDLRIKRMTNREYVEFAECYSRFGEAPRGSEPEPSEARARRNADAEVWVRDVLTRFVTLPPGQIEYEGRNVVDAAELIDIFGGRPEVMIQLLALVASENRLSEDAKKNFRSLLNSQYGSPQIDVSQIAIGGGPAQTVDAVAPSSSASDADAMASPGDALSGTTAALS